MKQQNLLIILLLLSIHTINKVSAQFEPPNYYSVDKYRVLDSAYIKFTYKLTSIKDTLHPETKYTDMQILLIGNHISKYYSQFVLDYNIEMTKLINKGAKAIPHNSEKGSYAYEIFKNSTDKSMTVTYNRTSLNQNFLYKDSTNDLNWKFTNEKNEILSYPCQKAITFFRGRTYEAWYAESIPINDGPWKFNNLPGLIMKVSDSQNHFIFECVGIEKLQPNQPIKLYNLQCTTVKRGVLEKLDARYHKNSDAYIRAIGTKTLVEDPVTKKWKEVFNSVRVLPFNPIERE